MKGAGGITAEVVADSIANDIRLTTLSLTYPRFIHAEFMTHRMFSRNASSSRAIPVTKMMEQVETYPAMPIHWGANRKGMQAKEEVEDTGACHSEWVDAAISSIAHVRELNSQGLHKQVANRILEPFQFIKVVVTATEWDNFFQLRLHPDAQPEIQELARVMNNAMARSYPRELGPGDWHVPFVNDGYIPAWNKESLDAVKCAVARCARVSYMNHDGSNPDIKKDIELHDRLLESRHMSPFEHVATPIRSTLAEDWWLENGVTHVTKDGNGFPYWSGNFRGWIQYRQVL